MGQETELKFVGPEDAFARLRRAPAFARFARGRRSLTRLLHGVYFDDDDFALRRAGFVLRVRTEGNGFVQTVKSVNGPNVATRTEVKAKVDGLSPNVDAIEDKALQRAIVKAVKPAELKPIFAVDVRRTTTLLKPRRGAEIEAAFDVGAIKTQGANRTISIPISEFELELLKGHPTDLVDCARAVTASVPLILSLQSKAERGYALVRDEVDAPVSAGRIVMPKGCTADEAFSQIVAHCLTHMLGNWPCITGAREPEGVHQMRVALRRLRSAMSFFDGSFRLAMREIEGELRDIAATLGKARDFDVFQESVLAPAAEAHGDDERLLDLATLVRARRRIAWHGMLEALEAERFRKLALELAAATFSRPWLDVSLGGGDAVRPALELARERLAHRYRRIGKLGDRIGDLDAAERHDLRKRLKKLRYALDFFSSLFKKKRVKKYAERLSELQDILGEMNDAAMARALVDDILKEHDGAGASAVGYAGGVVAGWHIGHMRERAKELEKRWKRFAKLKPPWA